MATTRDRRREIYRAKAEAELDALIKRGVMCCGNAFSSVLLIKGDLSEEERAGGILLSGKDGDALRSALVRLGYAPQDWAGLSSVTQDGQPLDPELFREALACLDPATVIILDEEAADCVRQAFADELAALDSFEEAIISEGLVVHLMGMRLLALGGFAASLTDSHRKQLMWARLKTIPPVGEPY